MRKSFLQLIYQCTFAIEHFLCVFASTKHELKKPAPRMLHNHPGAGFFNSCLASCEGAVSLLCPLDREHFSCRYRQRFSLNKPQNLKKLCLTKLQGLGIMHIVNHKNAAMGKKQTSSRFREPADGASRWKDGLCTGPGAAGLNGAQPLLGRTEPDRYSGE